MRASQDSSALNRRQRERDLERMSVTDFDLVVIGGGVTGAGAALDATTRGLSVALVEQRDYGSGTSSRSSKLFHGGLRYLEQFHFGLVGEALRERNLMVRALCPHLCSPTGFLYPLRRPLWERLYVGAGILLYELMARVSSSPLPWHRHLSRRGVARLATALDIDQVRGAVRYWDVVVDDARHTMTLARTAAAHGAALASSARVTGLDLGASRGEVEVVDLESGARLGIRTRAVINATGVWNDDVEELADTRGLDVRSSKGVHLVVPSDRIDSETGLILRTTESVLFVIPFEGHWIVGTTDTPWDLGRAHPAASRRDIEYLLGWANTVLRAPLKPEDVVGVFAGLRPLLAGETDQTSKLSREHAVSDNGRGLISVAGGKYTTYRVMARDAVDATAPYLPGLPRSRTHRIPLIGATEGTGERLNLRYGSLVAELQSMIHHRADLEEQVIHDAPYLRAEIVYAATHEGALHLDDFLTRRTRISIITRHRGLDAVEPVVDLVSEELGWNQADRELEKAHYRARVAAELESQSQADDRTADAARMGAPDVRTGVAE